MSLDQHLNKAQRNMLFDIFSAAAMCDLPVASAVESITLVSEQQEDIMTISRVIRKTSPDAPSCMLCAACFCRGNLNSFRLSGVQDLFLCDLDVQSCP
jgi:hypothetical protein